MDAATNLPPVIQSAAERPAPVAADTRVQLIDVLRGFALLGILLVNMTLFSYPVQKVFLAEQSWASPVDNVIDTILRIFAEGKFYPLFALLFGYGMALQMERAEAHGGRFIRLFSRRLLVLLMVGAVHAFLIWEGDILVWYAIFGFILIPFRRCKPITLLVWAVFFVQIPMAFYMLIYAFVSIGSSVPEIATVLESEMVSTDSESVKVVEESFRIFATGTFAEICIQRARNVLFMWKYGWFYAPVFVAMFLLGLYAARRRLLQAPGAHAGFLKRALLLGLLVGLPANAFYAAAYASGDPMGIDWMWVAGIMGFTIGGPALTFAYVSAIALALRHGEMGRLARAVAAAGRMGLSNYLLQSLICTTIFYSYGLGLYGSVGRAQGVLLAIVIYAIQLPLSVWWLSRFRFGPAECLWRTLTYGRRQPMRLS